MPQFTRFQSAKTFIAEESQEQLGTLMNNWQPNGNGNWQNIDFEPLITTGKEAVSDRELTRDEVKDIFSEVKVITEDLGITPKIPDEQKENIEKFINDWQNSVDTPLSEIDFEPLVTTIKDAVSNRELTDGEIDAIVSEVLNVVEQVGITPEEARTLAYDLQDIAEASQLPRTDDILTGTEASDFLYGGLGDDVLVGANGIVNEQGEIDTLLGGGGNDTFVLGDANQAFYNDNDAWTLGVKDYALIVDFNLAQDVIQLHGSANDYTLEALPEETGMTGTGIFYTPEGQLGVPELIGVIAGVELTNMDAGFSFA